MRERRKQLHHKFIFFFLPFLGGWVEKYWMSTHPSSSSSTLSAWTVKGRATLASFTLRSDSQIGGGGGDLEAAANSDVVG